MSLANFVKTELKNLMGSPATEKYPEGPATYKEGTRGHVVNDMDACVLCGVCQMRCPTRAITVDKKQFDYPLSDRQKAVLAEQARLAAERAAAALAAKRAAAQKDDAASAGTVKTEAARGTDGTAGAADKAEQ